MPASTVHKSSSTRAWGSRRRAITTGRCCITSPNLWSWVSRYCSAPAVNALGELLADDGQLRPARDRDAASAALTTVAAMAGVWGVRVHDVAQSADAARVVERMAREGR